MNYLSFLIRRLLDSIRDSKKVVNLFDMKKNNSNFIFFNLLYIKFFYSFEFLRNLKKIKQYNSYELKKNLYAKGLIDLDKKGFTSLFYIRRDKAKLMKNYVIGLNNHHCHKLGKINKKILLKKSKENNNLYFKRLKSYSVSRITGSINLREKNIVSEFLLSKQILDFAKNYLNTNKVSISASYFISLPAKIDEKEKINNAQYFHWDNDFKKFFKLYIYLSDVNPDSGPHIFIPHTHKKKLFQHKLHRPYNDRDIYNNYSEIKKFIGNAGTYFFVDSFGLHKGEVPKKNYRIMINAHYGYGKLLYSEYDNFIY